MKNWVNQPVERMAAGGRSLQWRRPKPPDSWHTPNETSERITGALGAVITIVLMAVLFRSVRGSARRSGSRYILEYGNAVRGLGVAVLLLGGFFLYAASRSSLDQRWIA